MKDQKNVVYVPLSKWNFTKYIRVFSGELKIEYVGKQDEPTK